MIFSHKIIERFRGARRLVVITGAGISAESGVPTFRGSDGLWRRYRAEDLATPQAFQRDPRLAWEWYDWRRQLISGKEPNAGHMAIAAMERLFEEFLLITKMWMGSTEGPETGNSSKSTGISGGLGAWVRERFSPITRFP